MPTETDDLALIKRRLILRDSLAFLGLALVTIVLFVITLFLFRSFTQHRAALAKRWSDRGISSLNAGKPGEAISALRSALVYSPGNQSYELLLAQALGDAGHIDEAYNYFIGFSETQPGNGLINLQLARLSAKKKDKQNAIRYYHASVYGTWEGDGVIRRRDVRLELARYLLAQNDHTNARIELIAIGGNSPDDHDLNMTLGDLLQRAGDPQTALTYYQRALAAKPDDSNALEQVVRLQYQTGHFTETHTLLNRVLSTPASHIPANYAELRTILDDTERILSLSPSHKLPTSESVSHIVAARQIAKNRLDSCIAVFSIPQQLPPPLQNFNRKMVNS